MNKETNNQNYFNQAEAQGKVGNRVQTRIDFSFAPKGSTGAVISADPAGMSRVGNVAQMVFDVAVQWDTQTVQLTQAGMESWLEKTDENENTIERTARRERLLGEQEELFILQPQQLLVDWFTKDEYERFLSELTQASENVDTQ